MPEGCGGRVLRVTGTDPAGPPPRAACPPTSLHLMPTAHCHPLRQAPGPAQACGPQGPWPWAITLTPGAASPLQSPSSRLVRLQVAAAHPVPREETVSPGPGACAHRRWVPGLGRPSTGALGGAADPALEVSLRACRTARARSHTRPALAPATAPPML